MTQIRCRCGNSVEIDDTLPFVRAKCFQCGYTIKIEFEEPSTEIRSFSRLSESPSEDEEEKDEKPEDE